MITLENLTCTFNGAVAVDDLSLEIPSGEVVVLVGPSGCGKSTTLRMINRLIRPASGRVLIDGEDVAIRSAADLRRSIGYVIQSVGLFPHLTISENIATVPKLLRWNKQRTDERVTELLNLVGLPAKTFARRFPAELSGGQRQRVGVARALAADPHVLLMDEPFGAIDPVVRSTLQDELLHIQDRLHKTIVFVTHDIDEAIKMGDRIALMKDGHLVQYAPPTEMLTAPAGAFAEEFLGENRTLRRMALLPISAYTGHFSNGPRPDLTIDANGSLRDALDACMRSLTGRVAVADGDRYLGNLDAAAIRELVQ